MITMQEWMEICNYKITEGSNYCWQCYGHNAHQLDSQSGIALSGYSVGIVFDTKTQVVYEVEVHDYENSRSYRIINPVYKNAYDTELKDRGLSDNAYYGVPFIDLEVDDDFIEKATAIVNGENYDTDILVPITLDDKDMLELFKLAHEADMTFNDYVNMILRNMIEKFKEKQK
jgi:hypothetical protein